MPNVIAAQPNIGDAVCESSVITFLVTRRKDIWDCCEGNKLHSIYPTVGIVKHSKNISRYDSVLLNRLHNTQSQTVCM